MSGTPADRDIDRTASMSAIWPYRWVTITAAMPSERTDASRSGAIVMLSGLTSTQTGDAADGPDSGAGVATGVGDNRDTIAGLDTQDSKRKLERVSPIRHADAVAHAAVVGEPPLELLDLRTKDVVLTAHDARDGPLQIDLTMHLRKREGRDGDGHGSQRSSVARAITGNLRRPPVQWIRYPADHRQWMSSSASSTV